MGHEDCLHPSQRAPLDCQQGLERDQAQQRRELSNRGASTVPPPGLLYERKSSGNVPYSQVHTLLCWVFADGSLYWRGNRDETKYRDSITLQYRPAADLSSLINGLNDHRPQIVHFSGHGNEGEVAGDTGQLGQSAVQPVSFVLLSKALAATDNPPDIIVLNSCKSSAAKKALLPTVKVVIAMRESVSDIAAANFAQSFYPVVASGQSVKAAFDQVAVEAVSISEADTPVLHCASGVNPSTIILT